MTNFAPGIYPNLSFPDYLAIEAMSNTRIGKAIMWDGSISMAHIRADMPVQATDSMLFGVFSHTGKLEPLKLMTRYVVMPPFHLDAENVTGKGERTESKATTYYKNRVRQFESVNAGKQVMEQAEYDRMMGVLEAIAGNDDAQQCFIDKGPVELTMVWQDPDTGILCKGRVDKVCETLGRMPDLKTTADITKFQTSITRYGYDRQQALYQDGYAILTGQLLEPWLIPVTSEAPHLCHAAPLHERALEIGRAKYKAVLTEYAACQKSGKWPGPKLAQAWTVPDYSGGEEQTYTKSPKVRIS